MAPRKRRGAGFYFLPLCCVVAACVGATAKTLHVTTVAGGYEQDYVPATSTALATPYSIARDSRGNIYISDSGNCRIRKINTKGVIVPFAGGRICGYGGDGGPATSAKLSGFTEIAFDSQGNLLIGDFGNQRIRKVATDRTITTIAGTGAIGYSGDGGTATQATFRYPTAVSSDPLGNVYIADGNNVIRMIDTAGDIHTVAGNGTRGFSGDTGPATSAQLNDPEAVVTDGNGNFYIADTGNSRVRRVDSSGTINTYAGNGQGQGAGSGGTATAASIGNVRGLLITGGKLYLSTNSAVWAVDLTTQIINVVAGAGPPKLGFNGDGKVALSTLFRIPWGLATDLSGDLLVADSNNDRIRKIDSSQTVSTIAGGYVGDGGQATAASTVQAWHCAFDSAGNLYIAGLGTERVRKVSTDGTITTFAGTGITGYSGDGGPASSATLNNPQAVAADGAGNIYIADTGNGVIRKVDSLGNITTFARIPATALAIDSGGNLYAADYSSVIWKINPAGSASIIAGRQYCYGYSGDGGPATQACLDLSFGVAVDNLGNVYIADWGTLRIRKVDARGIITTIAGNGTRGFAGDGGPATAASLSDPFDVSADDKGNLYIADSSNGRIRMVDSLGVIQTFAGTGLSGVSGYNGNNLPALQTNMFPVGLAMSPKGTLYVSDTERVRKIH